MAVEALAALTLSPCVGGVLSRKRSGSQDGIHIVIAPCIIQTDTTNENHIHQVMVALREYIGEVEQQVKIGVDIVEFVSWLD